MGYEDLDDLSELDEIPSFDEDLTLDFEDESLADEGGVSRTFIILGIFVVLAVLLIGVLLIFFLLQDDELSDEEKRSTEIAIGNATTIADATQTGVANTQLAIEAVTQTKIARDATGTAAAEAEAKQLTAIAQTDVASTATAIQQDANANATATAAEATAIQQTREWYETATQEAENEIATATEQARRRIVGRFELEDGALPEGTVVVRLYRDDADNTFDPIATPVPPTPTPTQTPEPSATATADLTPEPGASDIDPGSSLKTIEVGELQQSTLTTIQPDLWQFSVTTSGMVTVEFDPADDMQVMMSLNDTSGKALASATSDDEPGIVLEGVMVSPGQYTIWVTSLSGAGDYTLTLREGGAPGGDAGDDAGDDAMPAGDEPTPESMSVVPRAAGVALGAVDVMAQDGDPTATPEPDDDGDAGDDADETVEPPTPEVDDDTDASPAADTPAPEPTETPASEGDELVGEIIARDGEFDFSGLEPGTYWLTIDANLLPPEYRPEDDTGVVGILLRVPRDGEVEWIIPKNPEPTATPTVTYTPTVSDEMRLTQTAEAVLFTLTPTPEITDTPTPSTLGKTGVVPDVGGGDLEGEDGLFILGIAAVGLIAVVFVARKLRSST